MNTVIGNFFITSGISPGKLWIGRINDGEGGDFPRDEVLPLLVLPNRAEALERYYAEHF